MTTASRLDPRIARLFLLFAAIQSLLFWAAAAYLAFLFRSDGPGMMPIFFAVFTWFLLQLGSLAFYFGSRRRWANTVFLALHTLLAVTTMVAAAIFMAG